MVKHIKPFIRGIATYVPGLSSLGWRLRGRQPTHGATHSARYCYAVWMRYLVWGFANGLGNLDTVVEIGPGPSFGTGLAALLSGADRYYALDFTTHASTETNLATFDELVALFQQRAPVPDTSEFPTIQPTLESYAFPHHILSEERLAVALHPERWVGLYGWGALLAAL